MPRRAGRFDAHVDERHAPGMGCRTWQRRFRHDATGVFCQCEGGPGKVSDQLRYERVRGGTPLTWTFARPLTSPLSLRGATADPQAEGKGDHLKVHEGSARHTLARATIGACHRCSLTHPVTSMIGGAHTCPYDGPMALFEARRRLTANRRLCDQVLSEARLLYAA